MREAEFRDWLGRRRYGGKELTTVSNRLAWCRSVERALPALGFEEADLDAVHAAGRWDALLSAISKLRSDWRHNEAAARVIAPEAENPRQQMASARSAIGQYGHFADGDGPDYDESPDRGGSAGGTDRPFVLFDAAGQGFKPVRHGNQQTGLSAYRVKPKGASNRADDALEIETLAEVARLVLVEGLAARMQSLNGGAVNYLGYGKQKLVRYELDPAIAEEIGVPAKGQAELGDAMTDEQILARFTRKREFAYWFGDWLEADRIAFLRIARATHEAGLDWYHLRMSRQIRCGRKKVAAIDANEVFAQVAGKAPYAHVRKAEDREALGITDDWVSLEALADALDSAAGALARFSIGREGYWPDEINPDEPSALETARTPAPAESQSTNLILFGPPGTGKTYATAAEAVRLCDGLDPNDPLLHDSARRGDLRRRSDQLVEAGQIRLVTFHQNYSYEEFVEGLRPVTDSGTEDEVASQGAGFRLEPKRGIFREICAVAENARRNPGRSGGFDLAGRKLFKMSLGRAGVDDHIFDAAIEGGYAVLGWGGDLDWSDPRYEQWSAILDRWQEEKPDATGNDPNVVQMWPFRSAMKPGDLVIVSAGNSHFRAIGEVTGPYRFEPTETRDYNHRRPVRWLLVPDEPLPTEMIYGKRFMMQSCYQLKDALVNKDALSRLLPGGDGESDGRPDQFVLIIDEINRANISKVFGELITLIEPDKRLGAGAEALALRLPYSGETFGVPANLHIVGTMNTADRSIALLDTALRRRFTFRELPPRPDLLPADVEGVPLRRVLEVMNDRIEFLVDRDHRIGHAFFMGDGGSDRVAIDRTMRDKVIPLLQEYFFEDWSRVAAVLGERPEKGGGFLDCRKLKDPTGQGGADRLSWSVRPSFSVDAYLRLVGQPVSAADESAEAADADEAAEPAEAADDEA